MSEGSPIRNVYIISDGTGETASTMVRAALVQFQEEINIIRCKNVRTADQTLSVVEEAFQNHGFIVYTVVSPSLRSQIPEQAAEKGIPAIDLLGPLLNGLETWMGGLKQTGEVGKLRTVDEQYFRRVEAMEYTVKHDDGKLLTDLDKADIILVGISRTSKTPLSIFLSHKGWKVANIPIVLNQPLPQELFTIDQRKIVALMIDPDRLTQIRKKRLEKFGQDPGGDYASMQHIQDELEYALGLYRQNKRWPMMDVTERALEETATEIARLITTRMGKRRDILF